MFFMIAKARCGIVLLVICTGLAEAHGASLALVWDPSPSSGVAGYVLHVALSDGTGSVTYDVGNVTNAVVNNLVEGRTYNFYATAYDASRNESGPSNTLTYTVPAPVVRQFVKADAVTQGNWKGVFGSEGYWLAGVSPSALPAYARMTTAAPQWTWMAHMTAPSALLYPGASMDRIAACWYSFSQVAFDLNIADGRRHRLSIYFYDASASGRQENVEVVDRNTGAILDSRLMTNFSTGIYLTWDVSGSVEVRLRPNNVNAVASGIFFDPSPTGSG
jgi:hypothetical protein